MGDGGPEGPAGFPRSDTCEDILASQRHFYISKIAAKKSVRKAGEVQKQRTDCQNERPLNLAKRSLMMLGGLC